MEFKLRNRNNVMFSSIRFVVCIKANPSKSQKNAR